MINAPNNKSFGSGLTVIKEVHNCIDYIIDDFFSLIPIIPPYWKFDRVQKLLHDKDIFQDMVILQDMEG